MHFLVAELPLHLSAFPQHGGVQDATEDGIETLMQVYSCVPFDIFKKAIESPSLRIGLCSFSKLYLQTQYSHSRKVLITHDSDLQKPL
jgi:hypothetical protein